MNWWGNSKKTETRSQSQSQSLTPDKDKESLSGVLRTSRAHPLAQDWKPCLADEGYAREHGYDGERLQNMAQAFADYNWAKGDGMKDWCAAWRTWVRNEIKFNGGRHNVRRGPATLAERALELAEQARRLESENIAK